MSENQPDVALNQGLARWYRSATVRTFVILAAAHMMVDCLNTVWPMFKKLAGLDLERAGMLASVATLTGATLQPVFGLVADHGYRRQLVVLGCALAPVPMLLGPVSRYPHFMLHWSGYTAMFLILLLGMVGSAMFHPPAVSQAGDCALGRRSTVVALFIACGMMGMASSQRLFSAVYIGTAQHTEIMIVPALLVLTGVIFWWRPHESRQSGSFGLGVMLGKLIRLPARIVHLWVIQVLVTMAHMALVFLMPEFVEQRGYPAWWVNGGTFAVLIAGAVLTMVPVGHLADRFGRRILLMICLVGTAVSFYALITAPKLPLLWWAALVLSTGGMMGSVNPINVSYGQRLSPGNQSLITGVMMGLAWAAASPATWLAGSLAKRLSPTRALAWIGLVLMAAIVLGALLPAGRRRCEQV